MARAQVVPEQSIRQPDCVPEFDVYQPTWFKVEILRFGLRVKGYGMVGSAFEALHVVARD